MMPLRCLRIPVHAAAAVRAAQLPVPMTAAGALTAWRRHSLALGQPVATYLRACTDRHPWFGGTPRGADRPAQREPRTGREVGRTVRERWRPPCAARVRRRRMTHHGSRAIRSCLTCCEKEASRRSMRDSNCSFAASPSGGRMRPGCWGRSTVHLRRPTMRLPNSWRTFLRIEGTERGIGR